MASESLPPVALGVFVMPRNGRIVAASACASVGADNHLLRNGVAMLTFPAGNTSDVSYAMTGLQLSVLEGDRLTASVGSIQLIFG